MEGSVWSSESRDEPARRKRSGARFAAAAAVCGLASSVASSGALAYVGPGAGLTLLSALWGLVVAVVLALGFVMLWPIRRWRRRRAARQSNSPAALRAEVPSADRDGSGSGGRPQRASGIEVSHGGE